MGKQSTEPTRQSRPTWDTLEDWMRGQVQGLIQRVLEDEVTEFVGRTKSQRRAAVDAPSGYRNGYGKPRRLTVRCGTITVRRPRVRDCEERVESRVLPLFKRKSTKVDDVVPELYLHGLAQGDFELALQGLLGDEAPLSSSTVARLKEKWHGELAGWQSRRLDEVEAVYLWADGIYVKAGLDKEKAALLVVLAALSDGRKVVLAVTAGHRESTASWSAVLRDLAQRGLRPPRLVIGDGHVGIWAALRNVYPEAEEQRCWNHKILNVLEKLPTRQQPAAKALLCQIPYAETRREAERRRDQFGHWCRQREYADAAQCLKTDWERMVTMFVQGSFMALITMGVFRYALYGQGASIEQARTVAFTVLVLAQLFHAFNCRSDRDSLFTLGWGTNQALLWAVGGSGLLQVAIISLPWTREVFKVAFLTPQQWLLVLAVGTMPLVAMEVWKRLRGKSLRGVAAG